MPHNFAPSVHFYFDFFFFVHAVSGKVSLEMKDGLKSGQPATPQGQFQVALKCSLDVFYFVVSYNLAGASQASAPANDNFMGLLG